MRYSPELIKRFQDQYKSSYGLEISEEEADFELNRLARLLEIFYLAVFTKEKDINE